MRLWTSTRVDLPSTYKGFGPVMCGSRGSESKHPTPLAVASLNSFPVCFLSLRACPPRQCIQWSFRLAGCAEQLMSDSRGNETDQKSRDNLFLIIHKQQFRPISCQYFSKKLNLLARNTIFERPFFQHFINTARRVSDTVTICLFFEHCLVALLVRFSFVSAASLTLPDSHFSYSSDSSDSRYPRFLPLRPLAVLLPQHDPMYH